jgi:hypothetical protein
MSNHRAAFFAGLLSLAATAAGAATPVFTAGPETGDQIFVDQNTGVISACQVVTTFSGSSPIPAGVCGRLGSASPTVANNPSLVISIPVSNGSAGEFTFIVTNVYTGQVTQCEYFYQSGTHTFYGDCAVIGTLPTS